MEPKKKGREKKSFLPYQLLFDFIKRGLQVLIATGTKRDKESQKSNYRYFLPFPLLNFNLRGF